MLKIKTTTTCRFNISKISINTTEYLRDVSNIFVSKVLKECGNGCNDAKSEKHVSVQLLIQSNETEITWNTDESYRLDVITSGKIIDCLLLFIVSFYQNG